MAHFLKDPANLPLLSLVKRHVKDGFSGSFGLHFYYARRSTAFLELYSLLKTFYFFIRDRPFDQRAVSLFHTKLRVCQTKRQLSVIGHDQKSGGIAIQSSDGENARRDIPEKISHTAL